MVRIIKKSLSEVVTVIYDVPLRGYSFIYSRPASSLVRPSLCISLLSSVSLSSDSSSGGLGTFSSEIASFCPSAPVPVAESLIPLKSSHSSVVGTSPSSASSGCTFRYGSRKGFPVQCTVRTYCLPDHLPSAHPQLHRSQAPDHLPVQIR